MTHSSDMTLRQDVLDELDFEPSIDAANIGVAAKGGVVTLTGHVSSYAEKIAAEQAARRVKGVRAIAQEIEVRYPFDKKVSDDEIATRATDILNWDTAIRPKDAIKITVQHGIVTLSGQVDWHYQKQAAEDDMRKLSGVIGVTNLLTIKQRVQPTDVKEKIEAALKRNAEIEAQRIRVSVQDGGRVTLEGRIHSWDERETIRNAAWSAPGVRAVIDQLTLA